MVYYFMIKVEQDEKKITYSNVHFSQKIFFFHGKSVVNT